MYGTYEFINTDTVPYHYDSPHRNPIVNMDTVHEVYKIYAYIEMLI